MPAPLDTKATETPILLPCGRCGGKGYIRAFGHVHNGLCYECSGERGRRSTVEREERLARRRERDRARRARKVEVERAEVAAKVAAYRAEHPDVVQALHAHAEDHGVLSDLAGALRRVGSLTEAQAALVLKVAAEVDAAAAAPVVPVPEGRMPIAGRVVSFKSVPGYAYNSYDLKVLVEDDRGWRVYGTAPRAILRDGSGITTVDSGARVGDRVAFTATLERSRDDAGFGFFKRPAKASWSRREH